MTSTPPSTSTPRSVTPSAGAMPTTHGGSPAVTGAPPSTPTPWPSLTSPGRTSPGSVTSTPAKPPSSAPATSSATPGSTLPTSQNSQFLDRLRRAGQAINVDGMYHDSRGVQGSTPSHGSTTAPDKTVQPSKPSADPTRASTSSAPPRTGGATSGPGATGPEAHHHRTQGVPTGGYVPEFVGPLLWGLSLVGPALLPGSYPPGGTASQAPQEYLGPGTSAAAPDDPTLPPGNMIAGDDEQAMAEAAAAATSTAVSPEDDPELLRVFGKDDEATKIHELESQAEGFRHIANKQRQVAADMEALWQRVDGEITEEHIRNTETLATAGGHRSEAYYKLPPSVRAEVDKFEGLNRKNWNQAGGVGWTQLILGDKVRRQVWWNSEKNRSKTVAQTLENKAQRRRLKPTGCEEKLSDQLNRLQHQLNLLQRQRRRSDGTNSYYPIATGIFN